MSAQKILFVDDEPDVEVLMKQKFRRSLRQGKFEFFFAQNGNLALDVLQQNSDIRMVISDINMPEMDGLTLLKEINEKYPDVIAIIVSAYGDMNNIRAAMNLGAFDFVTKPINFDDLNITIDKTLDHIASLLESEKNKVQLDGILHELNVAAEIQQSILPKTFIEDNHIQLYAKMTAAKEVGGDFYDFFWINANKLGFVIADVSGKGIPAALFMTVSRTLLRAHALNKESAGQTMTEMNNALQKDNSNMMFVTTFYGILDIQTGTMQYANGGHNPPYILRSNGEVEAIQPIGEPALGVIESDGYTDKEVNLQPGDMVFLYTDGVPEAANADEDYYTDQKLATNLGKYKDLAPAELINTIEKDVITFAAGFPQSDDITMLAYRFLSKKD